MGINFRKLKVSIGLVGGNHHHRQPLFLHCCMKASSSWLQCARFWGGSVHPFPHSLVMLSTHLLLGLLGFLFDLGFHTVKSTAQLSCILATWPVHFHLLLKIISMRSGSLLLSLMYLFVIWSCHFTPSIFLSIAIWAAFSFWTIRLVMSMSLHHMWMLVWCIAWIFFPWVLVGIWVLADSGLARRIYSKRLRSFV